MYNRRSAFIQALIVFVLIVVISAVATIYTPKEDPLYKDTAYTVNQIQNTVNAIALNRDRLQLYMYSRYPKVPELDWENPDEITFDSATWKFRWLSHDWYFVVTFNMQDLSLTSMKSYEDLSNE